MKVELEMARDHSSKIAVFLPFLILLFSHVHNVGADVSLSDSVVGFDVKSIPDKPVCDFLPFGSLYPGEIRVRHIKHLMENTPRTLPNLQYSKYHGPSQLKTGDVLVIQAGLGWHSYVLVSSAVEGKAIFYADSNGLPMTDIAAVLTGDKITLQEGSLNAAMEMGYGVIGVIHPPDSEKTVLNAREIIGCKWGLFSSNSEHFATLAMTGSAKSPQMENIIRTLKIAAYTGCLAAAPDVPLDECLSLADLAVLAKMFFKELTNKKMSGVTTKLVSGAKYGFFAGVTVQGIVLSYNAYSNYKEMQSGEISEAEFWRAIKKDIASAGGSVIGSSIEHLATLAMTGSAKSPQTENLISTLKIAAHIGCLAAAPIVPLDECLSLVDLLSHIDLSKIFRKELILNAITETNTKMSGVTTKLVSGAKYGFFAGVTVQAVVLSYNAYSNYKEMQSGEISEAEFWRTIKEDIASAGGSVIGSSIGGALGSVLIPIPGVGTGLGSMLGAFAGSYVPVGFGWF